LPNNKNTAMEQEKDALPFNPKEGVAPTFAHFLCWPIDHTLLTHENRARSPSFPFIIRLAYCHLTDCHSTISVTDYYLKLSFFCSISYKETHQGSLEPNP